MFVVVVWMGSILTEFGKKTKIHEELYNDVQMVHDDRGHVMMKNAFHDWMHEQVQGIITDPELTWHPILVYIRAIPDAFVLQADTEGFYYIDCKTLDSYRPPAKGSAIPNLVIELTSYMFAYDRARLGIRTLIPIRYPEPYNIEKGFWIEPNSRYIPSCIFIPPESEGTKKKEEHIKMAKTIFGPDIHEVQLTRENCKSDSGDLFVPIPANMILAMQDWRDMIPAKKARNT